MRSAPFNFPERYANAMELVRKGVRTFTTSSVGRLFDAAAALLGFTRETSFEGQAAVWLEQVARNSVYAEPYPFPFADSKLDFRPLLTNLAWDRYRGRSAGRMRARISKSESLRASSMGLAQLARAARMIHFGYSRALREEFSKNELRFLEDLKRRSLIPHL